jgi:hypothetical protein
MKDLSTATHPREFIVNMIPPLTRLPIWMQTWRRRAAPYHQRQVDLWMSFWDSLQCQIEDKRAPECFVKQLMETDFKKQGISDIQGAFLAGSKSHPVSGGRE